MDIKKRIKEQGWTLEQLGAKIGVSQSALSHTLSGNPNLGLLQKIAQEINLPIEKLVSDEETTTQVSSITCPACGKPIKLRK